MGGGLGRRCQACSSTRVGGRWAGRPEDRDYSGSRSYAQSKLAQVLFTFELAERLEGDEVRVNALHPPTYMDKPMVRSLDVQPRSSVEEGAEAVMRLATGPDPGVASGVSVPLPHGPDRSGTLDSRSVPQRPPEIS